MIDVLYVTSTGDCSSPYAVLTAVYYETTDCTGNYVAFLSSLSSEGRGYGNSSCDDGITTYCTKKDYFGYAAVPEPYGTFT